MALVCDKQIYVARILISADSARSENVERDMKADKVLSDDLVSRLEGKIPAMAEGAINTAYINALAAGRSVMEVMDGMLVETTADGNHKVIRVAKPKHKVTLGGIIKVHRCS